MNERIQELIVQSGNGQFHNGKCYPHIGSRTLEDWDKFAELIVRECAEVLRKEMDRLDTLDRVVSAQTMDTARVLIKNHFGVE